MQRVVLYTKHTEKFMFPNYNLLVFQVKLTQLEIKVYQEVGATTLDTYNIPTAGLLTCLEDITQSYPSYCSSWIPICTILKP